MWWQPDRPDERVGGYFTFKASEGSELRLLATLTARQPFNMNEQRIPVLHGTVSLPGGGNAITLFDCLSVGTHLHGAYSSERLHPAVAALGAHIKSYDHVRVATCELTYTLLPQWFALTGFRPRIYGKRWRAGESMRYRLAYSPVRPPLIKTSLGTIRFLVRSLLPIMPSRNYDLHEYVGLQVRPPKPIHLEELRRGILWYLQNFLTFATDHRCTVGSIYVKLARRPELIELLFRERVESDEPPPHLEMLFTYPQIFARASEVFSSWFQLYNRLGPALNALFSVIYGSVSSTDVRFLNAVQAAESYDRRLRPVDVIKTESHNVRVESIMEAAPEEFRPWLRGKLHTSNEPFLNERLQRVFERPGEAFWKHMFGSRKKMRSRVWQIAQWRNALTHVTADIDEIREHLLDLHVATNQIVSAVKANLLLDLAFTEEQISTAFKYNQTYQFFSQEH